MASRTLATIISMRDQFTGPARRIAGSTRQIDREVRRTQNQIKQFGKDLLRLGAIGATALAGIAVASVNMGMEYSENLAKISTISDTSVVSMKQMGAEVLKLSNVTGASANALANDVYDAISSGVSTADAVKTVATTTSLAKAGFAETGKSLDLMTTIVNGYGKSMKEANYISDILIQTQNQGKVTVGELSESMGKIIPTANASNVSLEQIASGYAIMTSNGIKAAEATTYMNSMINELMKSGTMASKTVKNTTGKSFQELMKSGKSLGDVLKIMDKTAKANGKSLADMFGSSEAGKAALVLAKNEGKSFNDMIVKMKNSTGETQKALDKLNAEPVQKMRKAINQLKNKGIELGMALLPTANNLMEAFLKITEIPISPYIESILNVAKSTFEYISKNWSTIAPIILTIVTALTIYKIATIAMIAYTKAFAIAEAIKTAVLATGATTVNIMTIAQWALNAAMIANPIGLVIAGIAALIVIGILLYKNWDKIKLYCLGLWEKIKQLWVTIWNNPFGKLLVAITAVFNPISWLIGLGVALYKNWETIKLYASALWEAIKMLVSAYFEFWNSLRVNTMDFIIEKFNAVKNKVIELIQPLKTAFEFVKGIFGGESKKVEVKTTAVNGKNTVTMQKFAKGGIANRPSIFGEAGAEIAIPLNKSSRSKDLLAKANNLIGGNSNVTNNKQIQVIIQGDIYGFNDFKEKVAKAMYEVIHIDGSNVAVAK